MENNINKSIIYGNVYQNRYGKFLPVCSSITDRTTVTSILDYIHQTPHFKKYNRIAYAYRVQQVPIVFITEKKNIQLQYYQQSHSDQTIEGSGQKLLHLLEKFKIKNVFICCLIQQFNPLLPFQTTNYRAIVENSRILLDQLYKKVLNLVDKSAEIELNDLLLKNTKTLKLKKCNIADNIDLGEPLQKHNTAIKQRPNHIFSKGKPSFLTQTTKKLNANNSPPYQLKFMWQRCKVMKQQFSQLKQSLQQKQIDQLRYFVMYDKNILINNVVKLFTIYQGITKQQLTSSYQFQKIRQIQFQTLDKQKLRKLQDMLKSHRKLNVDSIFKINRAMGILFSIIELKIKFTKIFNRISDIMQKNQIIEEELKHEKKGAEKDTNSHNQIQIKTINSNFNS